jgi:hypothetical protein
LTETGVVGPPKAGPPSTAPPPPASFALVPASSPGPPLADPDDDPLVPPLDAPVDEPVAEAGDPEVSPDEDPDVAPDPAADEPDVAPEDPPETSPDEVPDDAPPASSEPEPPLFPAELLAQPAPSAKAHTNLSIPKRSFMGESPTSNDNAKYVAQESARAARAANTPIAQTDAWTRTSSEPSRRSGISPTW